MPRFDAGFFPTRSMATVLAVTALIGITAGSGYAQDDSGAAQPDPAPVTDPVINPATDMPDMAAIEQAWQRGDYVFAREGLERLATQTGTPLAQYRYGRILLEGRGGPRDVAGAAAWLQKAVDQNHLQAATLLARLYLSGAEPDIAPDPARAATLLSGAAARGDAEAQYYLGLLYSAGKGVAKNPETAFNWFLAAAEQQHVAAEYELARAYSRGIGTAENPKETLRWLTEAATAGHRDAQFFLANAYESGQGAPKNPAEARRWYRRAAEAGHPLSQRILGTKYMQGDGVEANPAEALRWMTKAADAGEPGALANMGYIYAKGIGVTPDDARAAMWYARAADAGVGRAMLAIGRFLETGRGVAPDLPRAVSYYRQAAKQGAPGAAEHLGQMALDGALGDAVAPQQATPWVAALARQDNAAALDWLKARAKDGMRQAQRDLGLYLLERNGEGDAASAADYLARAANAGEARAQLALGKLYTTGNGVSQDYVSAHKWLNIAAASGLAEAARNRDLIANLMSPEQVADAQAAARTFFDTASERAPQTPQTVQETQ